MKSIILIVFFSCASSTYLLAQYYPYSTNQITIYDYDLEKAFGKDFEQKTVVSKYYGDKKYRGEVFRTILRQSVYRLKDTVFMSYVYGEEGWAKEDTVQVKFLLSKPYQLDSLDRPSPINKAYHDIVLNVYRQALVLQKQSTKAKKER